jgi:hypothetical protein
VGAMFGALFFCGLSCVVPLQIFSWINMPVAKALSIPFPSQAGTNPTAFFLAAEAITGSIIGAMATAFVPLIAKRKR